MNPAYPFLIPFLAMASGLLIADRTGCQLPASVVPALAGIVLLVCFLPGRIPHYAAAAAFFFAYGFAAITPWHWTNSVSSPLVEFAHSGKVIIEGTVKGRPHNLPEGGRFYLDTEHVSSNGVWRQIQGTVLVNVSAGKLLIHRGDRVRIDTRLALPRPLGLPGEFDYRRYLGFQQVSVTGWLQASDDVILVKGGVNGGLLRKIDEVAVYLGDFILKMVPDRNISSVLLALLVGDQRHIPAELNEAYARAGVTHILSVSGFHIGILSWFVVTVFLLLLSSSETIALKINLRRSIPLLAVPFMLLYLALTGASPATSRSVLMLILFAVAMVLERESAPVNTLLISAFVLVALHPPTLFDLSFQLSFLSLWGIVVLVPPLSAQLDRLPSRWLKWGLQFMAVSAAATLVTAVPVLMAFNRVSIAGLATNFLIVPLLGYGAVLAGLCSFLLVALFPTAAGLLMKLAASLVAFSNSLILMCSQVPVVRYSGLTPLDFCLLIVLLGVVTFVSARRFKMTVCIAIPLFAVLTHVLDTPRPDGNLRIYMLSVGQAESLLVRFPGGDSMLVDGGGYLHDNGRDFGERILAPALRRLGVEKIETIIVTHAHPDHVGGLNFVVRDFPVGRILIPPSADSGDELAEFTEYARDHGIAIQHVAAGDSIHNRDRVSIAVLSPVGAKGDVRMTSGDLNDDSLVFRLVFDDFSMLFSADSGFSAEARLLADHADLRSTILKVAHHGSRHSTSEPFLDKVLPQAALISAGYANRFGLPALETLEQFSSRKIPVWRTDRDGTILVTSNGRDWHVSTPYVPSPRKH